MLKINLLPEHERKASLSTLEQFHRTPLFWIVAATMLSLPLLILWPTIQLKGHHLAQLQERIQTLEPKREEVERLRRLTEELRSSEAALQTLKQSFWSRRLNILSDLTPEGVWFTELTLDPLKGLVIQGSAIGQGGAEMVSVGRFVQDLKADPDFAATVKDIQIESIKRVQDREIEIVQFTLTASLVELKGL